MTAENTGRIFMMTAENTAWIFILTAISSWLGNATGCCHYIYCLPVSPPFDMTN